MSAVSAQIVLSAAKVTASAASLDPVVAAKRRKRLRAARVSLAAARGRSSASSLIEFAGVALPFRG